MEWEADREERTGANLQTHAPVTHLLKIELDQFPPTPETVPTVKGQAQHRVLGGRLLME